MSLASRSWRLSSGLLGNMGVLGRGCLGRPSPSMGLSSPLCFSASSFSCATSSSQLLCQLSAGPCSFCRGVRPMRQGRHRTCVLGSGILQPAFPNSQGYGRLETSYRSLPSQPLHSPLPVPHGNFGFRPPVAPPWRLDSLIRSPGCLPPGPCPSGLSEVSQVLRWSRGFSVQGSLLWSFFSASGLHPGHGSSLLLYAPLRVLDPSLPRRLAGSGSSFQEITRARDFLLWLCDQLGILVNLAKSTLIPSKRLDYLGMTLQLSPLRAFPSQARVHKALSLVAELESFRQQPRKLWLSLLSVMSSLSTVVPGSRLRMRALQLRLHVAGSGLQDDDLVSWDDSCLPDLRWWSVAAHLVVGVPLDLPQPDLVLYTDASDAGWGASLGSAHLSGSWSPTCCLSSINHRELLAVFLAFHGFSQLLRHQSVALFLDNTTALAYLRKEGGTRSSTLNSVAQVILRFCEVHSIRLLPRFIPGCLNVLADTLSRSSQSWAPSGLCARRFARTCFAGGLSQWTCLPPRSHTVFRFTSRRWWILRLRGWTRCYTPGIAFRRMRFPHSASFHVYWPKCVSREVWSSPWWLRFGLSGLGFRISWSSWWRFRSFFHTVAICSVSPTFITTIAIFALFS